MKEVNSKKATFSWEDTVQVNISLAELATIYAVMAKVTTPYVQDLLKEEGFDLKIDSFDNDVPYEVYIDAEQILIKHGVIKEEY